ncbi:MAG: hypothetical protein KHY62_06415 [Firmicutes bacterium]|nr:hypothetical protein [Bacillota bacterium]
MAYSDINVMLNVYAYIGYDDAKEGLKRVVDWEQQNAESAFNLLLCVLLLMAKICVFLP